MAKNLKLVMQMDKMGFYMNYARLIVAGSFNGSTDSFFMYTMGQEL